MKSIVMTVAFALTVPALAQDKPAAAPKPVAKPEASKPMARKHGPKRGEDARHCLELSSNTEIIKCAEEYL